VTLHLSEGILTVRVARAARRKRSRLKLQDLLDRITPENVQPTYDWGRDVGKEIL
jgi:antitoxin component of MazEF toxin-antitoxin module